MIFNLNLAVLCSFAVVLLFLSKFSVKKKILSYHFQGRDDLMGRYLDMLTLLRTAGGRYQSSYLLPSRILKTLKRTNQVRKINSAFDVPTFLSK